MSDHSATSEAWTSGQQLQPRTQIQQTEINQTKNITANNTAIIITKSKT